MLTHNELMEMWKIDCEIDRTKLMDHLYSLPQLHSRYLTHLQNYKVSLRKHLLKYQKGKLLKQRYYNGELTKDELVANGLQQYLFKRPLKSEMESLLDADVDLQLLQEQSLYIESLVGACESILKDISNRYYLMTNIVTYEKFQAGA